MICHSVNTFSTNTFSLLHRGLALILHVVQLLLQPNNILLFDHIRQGEAVRIIGQFSALTAWGAALVAGGLSAGILIETTSAERGKMQFQQLRLPPFM